MKLLSPTVERYQQVSRKGKGISGCRHGADRLRRLCFC